MKETEKRHLKKREILYLILAAVNIIYGILVRAIHTTHISFVIWILIGFGFIFCYILSRKNFLKKLPVFLRIVIFSVLAAGLVLFSFIEINIIKGFVNTPPEDLQYVIVLGAKIYGDEPSPSLRYRLDAAYDYLAENEGTICILTGGQGYDENFPEAEIMYDYMIGKGLSDSRIRIDSVSSDTAENIRNSLQFMESSDAPTGIVSNNYHIYRAMLIAENQGLSNVYGIPSRSPAAFVPHNMMKEFLSILKAYITGNI